MPASLIDEFEEFLKGKWLRLSANRRFVAENILALRSPIDVATVLEGAGRPGISQNYVRETMLLMIEAGLIGFGDLTSMSQICESTHANLIVGRCPWCAQDITHGRLVS